MATSESAISLIDFLALDGMGMPPPPMRGTRAATAGSRGLDIKAQESHEKTDRWFRKTVHCSNSSGTYSLHSYSKLDSCCQGNSENGLPSRIRRRCPPQNLSARHGSHPTDPEIPSQIEVGVVLGLFLKDSTKQVELSRVPRYCELSIIQDGLIPSLHSPLALHMEDILHSILSLAKWGSIRYLLKILGLENSRYRQRSVAHEHAVDPLCKDLAGFDPNFLSSI